jgi:DNA-binding NarL/FixJ family response regulator
MKVLIIDDSTLIRQRLIEALKRKNKKLIIESAQNAEEAKRQFALFSPDVVTLDVSLPDESGISLLEQFKQSNPSVYAIIFTNYPLSQIKKVCLELGADNFFYKANDFDTTVNTISEIENQQSHSTKQF